MVSALLSSDVSVLEDALADGEEFQILPRPADMKISGEDGVPVELLSDLGPFSDFIALEGKHRRLHSFYTEKELGSCLMKMYRSAKTSLEENGASTLYLAVGLLRWFESEKSVRSQVCPHRSDPGGDPPQIRRQGVCAVHAGRGCTDQYHAPGIFEAEF